YLHHNFVVALLNDLFGIQARGGCSCAGPYGHRLLGIDLDRSHAFEREITRGCEGIKPGWVRVNFNYFISETVFSFMLEAVEFIAEEGGAFLPHYDFDAATGLWRHEDGLGEPPASLDDVSYADGRLAAPLRRRTAPETELAGYLAEARALAERIASDPGHGSCRRPEAQTADFEALRWFPLPDERLPSGRGTAPSSTAS
ncbi:MAG: aminotransferase, partial [Actinobacteria bacterium]|nr:aminotransferase [Actinomycetota bacterium]